MKALVTGATSGIGLEMARYLASLHCDLILVARNKEKLLDVLKELEQITNVKIVAADLSRESKVKELYVLLKNDDIDILINDAGFGILGEFTDTSLDDELEMIDLNVRAVHILTKLFLKDMKKKNSGYILNVSSMAAFAPGPLMATYYSTKSYIYKLTISLYEELRKEKSKVSVSVLCPGHMPTGFDKRAGLPEVNVGIKPEKAAKIAIDKMFKKKLVIIPEKGVKFCVFMLRFMPIKMVGRIMYRLESYKRVKK